VPLPGARGHDARGGGARSACQPGDTRVSDRHRNGECRPRPQIGTECRRLPAGDGARGEGGAADAQARAHPLPRARDGARRARARPLRRRGGVPSGRPRSASAGTARRAGARSDRASTRWSRSRSPSTVSWPRCEGPPRPRHRRSPSRRWRAFSGTKALVLDLARIGAVRPDLVKVVAKPITTAAASECEVAVGEPTVARRLRTVIETRRATSGASGGVAGARARRRV